MTSVHQRRQLYRTTSCSARGRPGDKPAVEFSDGQNDYYKNAKRHRDGDKPAIEWPDGSDEYWKNGERHRDGDKPAVDCVDGRKKYYKNGLLHRDGDKPAVVLPDGTKQYWKNGVDYTKERTDRLVKRNLRIWYDNTYRDTEGKPFKARMERDMAEFEKFAYVLY